VVGFTAYLFIRVENLPLLLAKQAVGGESPSRSFKKYI
jgi:hypothetical protein